MTHLFPFLTAPFKTLSIVKTLFMAVILCLANAVAQPATAQAPLADSDAPIDIAADSLEVRQEENVAIWTGAVKVVQGDMVLESDRLEVHYTNNTDSSADQSTINRINASGNVRVTSPDEVATGQTGFYDLAAKTVILVGDVVLVRGDNTLRGERLVVELETGRSQLISGGGSGGRVSGTFRGAPNANQ